MEPGERAEDIEAEVLQMQQAIERRKKRREVASDEGSPRMEQPTPAPPPAHPESQESVRMQPPPAPPPAHPKSQESVRMQPAPAPPPAHPKSQESVRMPTTTHNETDGEERQLRWRSSHTRSTLTQGDDGRQDMKHTVLSSSVNLRQPAALLQSQPTLAQTEPAPSRSSQLLRNEDSTLGGTPPAEQDAIHIGITIRETMNVVVETAKVAWQTIQGRLIDAAHAMQRLLAGRLGRRLASVLIFVLLFYLSLYTIFTLFVSLISFNTSSITSGLMVGARLLSPVCILPYIGTTSFCQNIQAEPQGASQPSQPLIYQDIAASSEAWRYILETKVELAPMPERVLIGASSMRDLRAAIGLSNIPSKKELDKLFETFVLDSHTTARSLHEFFTDVDWAANRILLLTSGRLITALDTIKRDPRYQLQPTFRDMILEYLGFQESNRIRVTSEYLQFLDLASHRVQIAINSADNVLRHFQGLDKTLQEIDKLQRLAQSNVVSSQRAIQDHTFQNLLALVGYNREKMSSLRDDHLSLDMVAAHREAAIRHLISIKTLMTDYAHKLHSIKEHTLVWSLKHGSGYEGSQIDLDLHLLELQQAVQALSLSVDAHRGQFEKSKAAVVNTPVRTTTMVKS